MKRKSVQKNIINNMQKSTKNPDDFIMDRRAYTLYSTKYVDKMEKKKSFENTMSILT